MYLMILKYEKIKILLRVIPGVTMFFCLLLGGSIADVSILDFLK